MESREINSKCSSESAYSVLDEYNIHCFKCGINENLVMIPHRNKQKEMVGWIFVCGYCFAQVKGKNLKTRFASEGK